MEPASEIRAPARTENKAQVIATLKNKGAEIAKKVLPEKTRRWLTEAASHLQRGNGRKALETMSAPPTEVAPTDEGKKLEETVVKPQPEQTTEQKKGLASRLIETKASAQDHAQKAIQLFNLRVAETEVQEVHGNVTPEDARTQLEVLAKDESISTSEFISKSKQALSTSTQLKSQTEAEQKALEEQVSSRQSDIRWKIDERIRELDRAKGIKKVSAALEKRRLEGQKTVTQRQISRIEPQVEAKRQLINQITEQEKPIRLKQEEIILTEILHEVQAIRGEYESLLQEVFLDGTTTAEVREAYIQQVISPEVDKIIKERKLPASQKDAFYTALHTYINHRDETEEQTQPYRQELDHLFTYEAELFWGVEDDCKPLLNGGDKLIVQGIVAKMAAKDIVPVRELLLNPQLKGWEQRERFSRSFEKAVEPADRWSRNEESFGSQILREVSEDTTWHFPNMELWRAMKSSGRVNEIFGEVIQQQDQEYYATALDKSLSDTEGGYIDLLCYYPTPDAIRNLVVIAAADSQNYRTVHANWSLETLSKQPDWKQQLDEAEAVYPSLKTARPILESWNYREYGNQPNIQQAAGDLASSLFEGNPVDQRLTELATVALPNHSILDILTKRNVIPASEAATLKETGNLLERLSQETWEKQRQNDNSVPYIDGYSFKKGLRENLFVLLQSKPGEANDQQAETIKRFGTVSRMILDNQQNYQALSYLASQSVIEKLQDPSLKPENITIFLEAYKTVPDLISNYKLLNEFCEQFEANIANKLLTTDVMGKLSENQRNFWNVWKKVTNCSTEMSLFLSKNGGGFTDFYQDKHLTPAFLEEFYKDAFSKGTQVDTYGLNMLIRDGFLDNFPRTDFAIWNAINQGNSYPSRQFAVEHLSEIKGYFNEKGEPNARLLVYLAKGGTVDLQQAFLSEEALNTFNETEQAFWRGWRNLPDRGKIIFNQKLDNNPQITESLVKEIKIFNTLFEEIEQSPSQELQKIKDQLISLLLENSQPEQALRKVRALFERNNLPDFGKKFRIFEILYCTQETDGKTRFDREMEQKGEKLSPILRKASRLRRLDTIYKDLLRINIDSGDVSLKNYLTAMQEGQVLLDRIEAQGTSSLSSAEARRVTRFLNRLNVLYENSLLGRQRIKAATPLPDFLSLEARIASLKEDLQVKEGQRIIDRVSEMFVKPLGYESIDAVLAHMDSIKEQAHNRNLSNPRVQEGQLEINAGDLLKGIQDDVLGYILQNGSIAREYIGVNAYSDSTPFDTDTGMVLQEDLEGGLPHVISSSPAQGYGNLIIVVRNRGQFVRTDQQETVNLQYNPQNYELFHSGVVGERHYGVRTGFPATEIDAVILKQDLLDETQANMLKREGIFFNIANNGFYVPVVNPEGKVIFTEADYNKYRLNQQLITANLASEEFKPNEFIDSLKSSPYLKTLYEMDSGVGEGYSTEQHTSMVMSQFEKYFSRDFESTFLTKDDFRLMLSLHDIGKPVAVYATGSTNAQHEYTKKVLVYALQATGTQPNKVDTILSLVDQDILGEYFKGQTDAQNSVQQISELAETVGVSPNDLVEALKMYYICDAGSYTTDAGGQASLDSLFVFNHNEENNSVTFSEKNEAKYQELLNLIKS